MYSRILVAWRQLHAADTLTYVLGGLQTLGSHARATPARSILCVLVAQTRKQPPHQHLHRHTGLLEDGMLHCSADSIQQWLQMLLVFIPGMAAHPPARC
jgi:hypothetical protein